MSLLPRALVAAIIALIGVVAVASPALAHIDRDPADVPSGSGASKVSTPGIDEPRTTMSHLPDSASSASTPETSDSPIPPTWLIGTAAEPVASTPTSIVGADEVEEDAKGSAGSIVFYAVVLVVLAGGATVLYRARRSQ